MATTLAPWGALPEPGDEMTADEFLRVDTLIASGAEPQDAFVAVTGVPGTFMVGWDGYADAVANYRAAVRRSATNLPAGVAALAYVRDQQHPAILRCRNHGACGAHPQEQHADECPVGDLVNAVEQLLAPRPARRTVLLRAGVHDGLGRASGAGRAGG
jgi:hypothetical protein